MSSSVCLKNPVSNGIRRAEHIQKRVSSRTGMTVTNHYTEVIIIISSQEQGSQGFTRKKNLFTGKYYAFHLIEKVIIAKGPMEDLEDSHPPFNKCLWQLSGDQEYSLSGLHSSSTKYMQVGIKQYLSLIKIIKKKEGEEWLVDCSTAF